MKALTICQPYAELIARGDKRVENREWSTKYRGPLYIHAGKSRAWLHDTAEGMREEFGRDIEFGAIVAIATLADCINIANVRRGMAAQRWPWLADHPHTSGTWCWVLGNVRRVKPLPWRGAQGLWDCEAVTESEDGPCQECGSESPSHIQRDDDGPCRERRPLSEFLQATVT